MMNENYEEQVLKIDFFSKYKNLVPFIGEKYSNHKILIVGESHFLRQKFQTQLSDYFYEGNLENLDLGLIQNISELSTRKECTKEKRHVIHRNLNKALTELDLNYSNICYYNFFLKPAIYGKTINQSQKDIDMARFVMKELMEILRPNVIIFVSRKAYQFAQKNGKSHSVPHPTTSWWNRKSKVHGNSTGKEKFKGLLFPNIKKTTD